MSALPELKTCRHCRKSFRGGHYCETAQRTIRSEELGGFLLAAAVGYATNSAVLGGLAGGSITGGIVGDPANDGEILESFLDS